MNGAWEHSSTVLNRSETPTHPAIQTSSAPKRFDAEKLRGNVPARPVQISSCNSLTARSSLLSSARISTRGAPQPAQFSIEVLPPCLLFCLLPSRSTKVTQVCNQLLARCTLNHLPRGLFRRHRSEAPDSVSPYVKSIGRLRAHLWLGVMSHEET